MNGIEIAAILTGLLAIAALGTLILQLCARSDRVWLLCMGIVGLPLSLMTFYLVRIPVDSILTQWLGRGSTSLTVCKLWYAPLTEEPAKLLPFLLLWPLFRRNLDEANRVLVALSVGLGFAVGEMWLVAKLAGQDPAIAKLAFYEFGGFLNERLITCVAHSGFTVIALWGLQRGGIRLVIGIAGAMILHFLANFPIFLMNIDFGGLGKPTWSAMLMVWLICWGVGSAVLLGVMHAGIERIVHLLMTAKVKCPECGEIYRQPLLGGNFGVWRYEPCGACRKWHWISLKDVQ